MSDGKVMHRNMVAVGAVLIQLCLGAIYAWSVFTTPLVASDPADVTNLYKASFLDIEEGKLTELKTQLKPYKLGIEEAKKALKAAQKKDDSKAEITAAQEALKAVRAKNIPLMHDVCATFGVKEKVQSVEYGLSKTKTQVVFGVGLALFAIVMVLAGRIMPKVGPRFLAIAGGVVLGAGYLLGGLVQPGEFWSALVFIGVLGGAGIGLGYVVPIAVGMKWFPDKKGLITGLAVAGFGFGALLWIILGSKLGPIGGAHLIASLGLPKVFMIFGGAFMLLCLVGSIWMKNPPVDWKPAGWSPPVASASGKHVAGMVDYKSRQMLSTPQFYMIFICFLVSAGAGLMTIGLMKLFPSEALKNAGHKLEEVKGITSLAMAVFFSLANGIGRVAWGALSDKIGRKMSITIMMASQGVLVILFQWMAGTPATLYLGAALIGFNFGGNFALFPAITADTFGSKNVGQNYGWVFLSYGVGGICCPILGGYLGDMGNFPLAFTICGIAVLAAAGIIAMVKPPKAAA